MGFGKNCRRLRSCALFSEWEIGFFDEEIFIRYLHIFKKANEALENKEQSQA